MRKLIPNDMSAAAAETLILAGNTVALATYGQSGANEEMAEREGFEPPVSLRPQKFSRLPQ